MVWKPHATVAAIIERDDKFLLVEELIDGKLLFNQPAGHLEPDESFIEAVIRETQEESAWQFTPEYVIGIYLWKHPENGKSFLRIAFSGSCDNHDPTQTLDDGIQATVWKTRDEIASRVEQLRSPMVIDCIDDYIAGRRFPLEILSTVAS